MSQDVDKLVSVVSDLVHSTQAATKDNAERMTRIEVNFEHMISAVQGVSQASKEAIESNSKLEKKIISLEENTINKVILLEDTINENSSEIGLMSGRIGVLELINANEAGRKEGQDEANKLNQTKATNYWGRTLGLITIAVAITAIISQFITSSGSTS